MIRTKYDVFGRGLKLQIAIVVSCQCAFVLFGYDQGVFSGIVTNQNWKDTFHNPTSSVEGILVSIYNLGAFSGTILSFIFAEKLGRRWSMWVAMIWIIVGAALQCTAYSRAQLLVARYVTGIGTGIETSTVPIYQSELCDAEKRGRLVSSEPLFVGVGIVIAYFFDYGMSYVAGSTAWRVPIAGQTAFCFLVIALVFGLPESPRWLYYHGKEEEALQVLCDVWDATPEDPRVHKMHTEITEAIALERRSGEYKWRQLFHRDEVQTGRRVLLAYGMQFMNQMGGINMLIYFVPSALQENVGLSPNTSQLIGGAIQCMFIVGSIFPTFLLDRYGRRRQMMWGSLGTGFCMMMVSILLSFKYKQDQYSEEIGTKTSEAAVAFFFLYMIFFGATANCIPWVYVPEILPLHARSKGTAIGISANWLWNFVVVMISPSAISNLHWQAYLIWMCLNFSFIPLVFFFYPETNQLSLEEIDYLFIKQGNKGNKKFFSRAGPVLESLKPVAQIERDLEREAGRSEGKGYAVPDDAAEKTENIDHEDEKSNQSKAGE